MMDGLWISILTIIALLVLIGIRLENIHKLLRGILFHLVEIKEQKLK